MAASTPGLPFSNRSEAGRVLAAQLAEYADHPDTLVLALPRGGVPVAYEVALALRAPLDVVLVRKLGVPGYEELAMGAIASGGVRIMNDDVVGQLRMSEKAIEEIATREGEEILRRERAYRGDRPPPDVRGRTVILIDDGLATGATMRAAAQAIRSRVPARLIAAVPVAAKETRDAMLADVDEIVCVATPEPFQAVGLWYRNFAQTTDDEVRLLLARSRHT